MYYKIQEMGYFNCIDSFKIDFFFAFLISELFFLNKLDIYIFFFLKEKLDIYIEEKK